MVLIITSADTLLDNVVKIYSLRLHDLLNGCDIERYTKYVQNIDAATNRFVDKDIQDVFP